MSEQIRDNIDRYGWHAFHIVDEDGRRPDFCYSVGFEQTFDHPEIVIFGLGREVAHGILADIAAGLGRGVRFEPYKRLDGVIADEFEVVFKPVRMEAFADYLAGGVDYYGQPFRAWVMLWPDLAGRLPGDPGCRVTVQDEALEIVLD